MAVIGPASRDPDTLAFGMAWCGLCGLHQFPARMSQTIPTVHTACPLCAPDSYVGKRPTFDRTPPVHVVTWLTDDSQRIPREAS